MHPRSGDEIRASVNPAPIGAGSSVVSGNEDAIFLCDAGATDTYRCAAIELPAEPPEWIHLMTPGEMVANDGRSFLLDDPTRVVAASQARLRTMVIDYEHQTDLAEQNGQPAPAAGWIKELAVRPDGIWGRVEWTATAAEHIRKREYRFLSPTFTASKDAPHRVGLIMRAALTNNPALQLTALAKTQTQNGDSEMNEFLKALAKLLGLGEDATEEQALAALKTNTEQLASSQALVTATRKALDLDDKADVTAITKAIGDIKTTVATAKSGDDPDPAKFVPIEEFTALAKKVEDMQMTSATDKAATAVDDALKQGKVPPSMKEWATAYAKSDLDGFLAYCEKSPTIFKPGSDVPATPTTGGANGLSGVDLQICKMMGNDPAKVAETRKAETQETVQ